MTPPLQAGQPLACWSHRVTQDAALAWSRMLDDPNPIHHDASTVLALGLGDRPINPGPANIAYFYNMLEACFPGAQARSVKARLTGNIFVGDFVEVSGAIAAVEAHELGSLVRCSLALRGGEKMKIAALAIADLLVSHRATPAR